MVEIGGRPILWHIMMHYSRYGFKEFVIALGYKGEYIKRYMVDYCSLNSNLRVKLGSGSVKPHDRHEEDWVVDLIDIGQRTNTGGRIKRLAPYLGDGTFMLTWGDGVSTVDLRALLAFHRRHGRLATVTAVRPPARFGRLEMTGDRVTRFEEKPLMSEGWINGAFFVLEPGVLEYITGDATQFEREPLEHLAQDGELMATAGGIPALGVDPAPGPAAAARAKGIDTLLAFFGRDLAHRLAAEGRRADVIHANNVLAHVANTNGFVAGIAALLKDDGVAVLEAPYVKDLIDHGEFDTIYDEHLCYFSVTALDRLFRRHGLYLNRVEPLAIHGGSLRLFAELADRPDDSVTTHLEAERRLGLDRLDYYAGFAARVRSTRDRLAALLAGLKRRGARLAGYGAAAKGAILLNYVGIGPETLDFVVDRNAHKQGRWLPGVRLPIAAPERLLEVQPDYVLILPWNFKEEIMEQQAEYRRRGGRFIVPIPEPVIL